MRATLLAVLLLPALALAGIRAAAGDEKPAEAPPPAAEKEFEPPPGWKKKQRGQYVVYCRKQSVQGTRLPVEKCYDEQGIRDMIASQRDDQQKVDQMRRICGSQAACGAN